MHRYEELEKLYYKKKYLRIFFKTILVIVTIGVVYFVYNLQQIQKKDSTTISKQPIHKSVEKIKKPKYIDETELNKTKHSSNTTIQKLTLKPILPDINIQKNNIQNPILPKIEKPKPKTVEKKPIAVPKKEIKTVTRPEPPKINIIVKTEKQTLDSFIKLFYNSPNYDLAIKIANIYYKKKNYKKSIIWSKKANELQPEDYESWYIFAKSLIKLGKTKEAKKVLISYLNTYGADEEIENLLRSIK